jgi:hypothetical protein
VSEAPEVPCDTRDFTYRLIYYLSCIQMVNLSIFFYLMIATFRASFYWQYGNKVREDVPAHT